MCGIVGVVGTPHASYETYQGLLLLQHRGQDGAGVLSYDQEERQFHLHKEHGFVSHVFEKETLDRLTGTCAIGHTRYATIASKNAKSLTRDLQPMVLSYPYGIGMVHNGNIFNSKSQTEWLKDEKDRLLLSANDVEIILNIIADSLTTKKSSDLFEGLALAVSNVMERCKGGYSVVSLLANKGLFAFRDPFGMRPLIIGKRKLTPNEGEGHSWILASESNVLNFLGYEIVRDVKPGELILITNDGELKSQMIAPKKMAHCMFEWIYFANPESTLEKQNVYQKRLELGQGLAKRISGLIAKGEISPDVIVPVPETSRVSAISLSETLKIPYRELLIKNRYIQRSFILPDQSARERAVQLKITPILSELKGKKVLLVDDSIVRGTTSKRLVDMLKEADVKEIYFASTCPPIKHPCFFGIDFPNEEELIAYKYSEDQMAQILGANKIIYQELEELENTLSEINLCTGCLTGKYPWKACDDMSAFTRQRLDRS